MNFIPLFALLTILDVIAVLSARFYIEKKKRVYQWISILAFGACAPVVTQLMAYEATAVVNLLWVSLSTVLVSVACIFLFNERLNRWQFFGIVLILVGMGLL